MNLSLLSLHNFVYRTIVFNFHNFVECVDYICDSYYIRLSNRLKFHGSVIRPAMQHGQECWASEGAKVIYWEKRILRWASRVTMKDGMDRVKNENTGRTLGIA